MSCARSGLAGHGRRGLPAASLLPETLECRWREEQIEYRQLAQSGSDAGETVELAREIGADWVVLDGYQFGTEFQRAVKNAEMRLLVVDDDGCARHYVADRSSDQNPCTLGNMYPSHDSGAVLLLRMRYALLRGEFLQARPADRTHPARAQRVLVTLGGGDPDNCTHTILEAIALIPGLTIIAVVGPSNPRAAELEQLAQRAGGRIAIRRNLTSPAAVNGMGGSRYFRGRHHMLGAGFHGLADASGGTLAENQRPNATSLDALGVAKNLGRHGELSEETSAPHSRTSSMILRCARQCRERA